MARTFLRLTDRQFWRMTPRKLLAMIDEYNDIRKCEAKESAYIASGGKVELERDKKRERNTEHVYWDPFFC